MFPEFVAAGFDPGEFYAESDDNIHVQLEAEINDLDQQSPAPYALFCYLTLLAPGGQWPEGRREALTELLKSHVSSDVWGKLVRVDALFEAWRQQPSLDPLETIVSIFETLEGFDGTFLAEKIDSYPNGGFVPRTMTQAEFEALAP